MVLRITFRSSARKTGTRIGPRLLRISYRHLLLIAFNRYVSSVNNPEASGRYLGNRHSATCSLKTDYSRSRERYRAGRLHTVQCRTPLLRTKPCFLNLHQHGDIHPDQHELTLKILIPSPILTWRRAPCLHSIFKIVLDSSSLHRVAVAQRSTRKGSSCQVAGGLISTPPSPRDCLITTRQLANSCPLFDSPLCRKNVCL